MYEWGSARHYSKPSGPPWLERGWVESAFAEEIDASRGDPELNDATTSKQSIVELSQLVEARMLHADGPDPWDDIVTASNPLTRQWMIRKAILADGTHPGLPLLAIARLKRIIEERRRHEAWIVRRGRSERDGWAIARVGLARDLCGQSLRTIAQDLRASETKVRRMYAAHRDELQEHSAYSVRIAEVVDKEFDNQGERRCGVRR